ILAMIGIYGVVAYTVAQRTHEIGIRMAMGAQPKEILRMVLKHGARLALIGVAAGIAGALILMRFLADLLYNISAADPVTFTSVAVILFLVVLAACYIPARRATRVDPLAALRYE
ncbi:MAG: FtsX-like permease family protein, partial [Candidatus Acidiferrum sp.]